MGIVDRSEFDRQLAPNGKIMIPEARGWLYLFEYSQSKLTEIKGLTGVGFVEMR